MLEVDAVNKISDFTVDVVKEGYFSIVRQANLADLNKHVNLKYQLLSNRTRSGDMQLEYVVSAKIVADTFIKSLQQ